MLNTHANTLLNALAMRTTVTPTDVRNIPAGVLSTYIAQEMDSIEGEDSLWDVDTVAIMVRDCQLAYEM